MRALSCAIAEGRVPETEAPRGEGKKKSGAKREGRAVRPGSEKGVGDVPSPKRSQLQAGLARIMPLISNVLRRVRPKSCEGRVWLRDGLFPRSRDVKEVISAICDGTEPNRLRVFRPSHAVLVRSANSVGTLSDSEEGERGVGGGCEARGSKDTEIDETKQWRPTLACR